MYYQIKHFINENQEKINNFLKDIGDRVVDIKISSSATNDEWSTDIIVVYKEGNTNTETDIKSKLIKYLSNLTSFTDKDIIEYFCPSDFDLEDIEYLCMKPATEERNTDKHCLECWRKALEKY
ncbi:MAG: hypothetical protein H0Z24_05675 [Thermosipho sp. (in: Bacteria)]|nr:hypothetical protein [Thermosipho sp. (in: thermotogales)]